MIEIAVKPRVSWVKKIFGIPQDQNVVWWLIGKQNNPKSQMIGLLGFIAIFWVAYRSPWGAVAMLLGMYIHELGHFAVFIQNGIKSVVLILFPLGAVAAPINKEEDARSDLLPWWNIGWLLQAGPTMNVLQVAIGIVLVRTNFLSELGHQMILVNSVLAVFNLLPLWNMDGGQLFHVIYSSLNEQYDVFVAAIGIIVSAGIMGVILISPIGQGGIEVLRALFQNFGLIFFLLLMAAGIWHKQGKDNPLHWKSGQAMTTKQVVIQLVYYIFLVVATLVLMTL